nr:hypothetical protein [Verrucomicrobium spinosum]
MLARIPKALEQFTHARSNGRFASSDHDVPGGVTIHFCQDVFYRHIIPFGIP